MLAGRARRGFHLIRPCRRQDHRGLLAQPHEYARRFKWQGSSIKNNERMCTSKHRSLTLIRSISNITYLILSNCENFPIRFGTSFHFLLDHVGIANRVCRQVFPRRTRSTRATRHPQVQGGIARGQLLVRREDGYFTHTHTYTHTRTRTTHVCVCVCVYI